MRLTPIPTPTISGPRNGGGISFAPVLGRGPQGLPGPGSAAWVAGEAVTTGAVRQAPDGSYIKATASRTTRSSFDATEQGFWTSVGSDPTTFDGIKLAASTAQAMRKPTQPLVGAQQIVDSLSSTPLTGWSVASPVTGLSYPYTSAAVTAFNLLSGGSYVANDLLLTEPLYATPRKDPIFRISGPFKYLFDSSSQHVGTWIASRQDSGLTGGTTGNQGQAAWSIPAGSRYIMLPFRAVGSGTTVMKARIWASKDGGPLKPFRALSDHDGNIEITLPADGLYGFLPIDLGATGQWNIVIDCANATWGGVWTLATLPPAAPTVRAGRALLIGDSFFTPEQGQFATSAGAVMRIVRSLGMEAHVSAQGGTGVCARGAGDVYLNYLERVTQAGGDVDGFFDDTDQPAYIGVLLSQNDETKGFAGTSSFDTNFAALMRALRGRFPNAPIDVYGIMHTRSETGPASGGRPYATKNDAYFALEDQAQAFIAANPDLNIGYVPGLLRAGIATGTGYMGATTGTGTSDTATWTDGSHASPINGTAPTGHGQIATQVLAVTTAKRPQILRPDGGYQRTRTVTPAEWSALQTAATADGVSTLTAKAVAAAYRPVIDLGSVAITGLVTGTTYLWAPTVGVVTAATAGSAAAAFQIDASQYAISGLTTKMRLSLNGFVNATAPGCDIVAELVLAGALSGAGDPSIAVGASLSPAYVATITAPAAGAKPAVSSGQQNAPGTNTFYVVKITVSANMAAGSTVRLRGKLEVNNV